MATHSSVLAWRIPWTKVPGGLQSVRSQRVRYDWVTNAFTSYLPHQSPPGYTILMALWIIPKDLSFASQGSIVTCSKAYLWFSPRACWTLLSQSPPHPHPVGAGTGTSFEPCRFLWCQMWKEGTTMTESHWRGDSERSWLSGWLTSADGLGLSEPSPNLWWAAGWVRWERPGGALSMRDGIAFSCVRASSARGCSPLGLTYLGMLSSFFFLLAHPLLFLFII